MQQRIGAYEYYDLSGRGVTHVPNSATVYNTNTNNNNTSPLIDTQAKIISDYLLFTSYQQFLIDQTDSLKDSKFNYVRGANPIEAVDLVYQETTANLRLAYLEQMEQTLEGDKQKEELIKQNVEGYKRSTVFNFDGFLAEVIDIGIDYALEQVNKLLPSEYQLNVDVQDGEFTGFSVGGIGYNVKENTISYDGSFFDGLVRGGLDILNDLLPDFLQASLGLDTLSIGEIVIDLDDLDDGVNFPVVGDISVVNRGGDIIVSVGGKEVSVTNIAIDVAARGLSGLLEGGLASINRQLPEGLSVGIEIGEGFIPKVSLGPVSLDLGSGGLQIDARGVENLLEGQLNKYVFNQLPGPLSAIARSAWNALDLPALIGLDSIPGLSPSVDPSPPPEHSLSINNRGQPSLPPIVTSPPMVGDFPVQGAADNVA